MRCNLTKPSFYTLVMTGLSRPSPGDRFQRAQNFHTVRESHHTWSVLKHIHQEQLKVANKRYACFLLNMTNDSQAFFDTYKHVWNGSDLKVAVDGSANFLDKHRQLHTADVISGDFDSIDAGLIHRLQSPRRPQRARLPQEKSSQCDKVEASTRTPQIVETPSQKETDFTKAIHVAMKLRPEIQNFFALYYNDGQRMDHLFGLINTLHLIKKNIFILNIRSRTISWLLQPGEHTILKPHGQELCSLVPFNGATEVKTQGLLYNVNKHTPMHFGALISTSNFCQPARDRIIVETKGELLWSLDLYKADAM